MVRVSAFCSDTIRNWSVTGNVETLQMMALLRGLYCLYPPSEPCEFSWHVERTDATTQLRMSKLTVLSSFFYLTTTMGLSEAHIP